MVAGGPDSTAELVVAVALCLVFEVGWKHCVVRLRDAISASRLGPWRLPINPMRQAAPPTGAPTLGPPLAQSIQLIFGENLGYSRE